MQSKQLVILGIDDSEDDLVLLQRHLEEIPGLEFELQKAHGAEEGLAALRCPEVDVVFLDYLLGAQSGMDVLERIRATEDPRAVIMMTGMTSVSLAVSLSRAGADDYIDKNCMNPDLLRRAIDNALAQQRRRETYHQYKVLLKELQVANRLLEQKNSRLADLYQTAHQFVDNVSHEFRTPLAVIKEYASLMRDGILGPINDEQGQFLDVIGNRVEDLALMVDDMLDISRFGAGMLHVTRKPCRVCEILDHIRSNLDRRAEINKVNVQVNVASNLPEVFCDPEKIGRTVINLAVNAIKFAPEGGLVEIAARHDAQNGEVTLSVTDNGPGISEQNQRIIFERFSQVHGDIRQSTKGFGLGLSIAKELVHVNFGQITVKSALGQGSTFAFTVPTAKPRNVLGRYVEWLCLVEKPAAVSLIVAHTEAVADPTAVQEARTFLYKQARPRDLVFAPAAGVWVLVAQCEASELPTLLEHHEQNREEANRNRPKGALPAIRYSVRGTWEVPNDRQGLLARFEETMGTREVAIG